MNLQELDVIVRVAGATLLVVAAVLGGGRGDRRDARLFIPLALCLCGFLAGNTPDPALRLSGVAGEIATLLSGFGVVFLWWFCLAVFDRSFRPRGLVLAAGVAWILIASADRGLFGPAIAQRGLSWILVAMGLAIVAHLVWRLIQDRDGDLVDYRRQSRVIVVVLLAGQLLADLMVDVLMGMDWAPQVFTIGQNMALLGFTGFLVHLGVRTRDNARARAGTGAPPSSPSPALEVAGSDLGERLRRLIEVERVHLDADLNFDRFVRMMGASERTVRGLINHQLGHDHFRTFLNAHRMVEARRLLADPGRSQDKLIAIALDSGFASLPSFNRVFQESEGRSPGAFRRAVLSDEHSGSATGDARAGA